MTAYVRPFLRHRFHRSGSRSVKDPFLFLARSLASLRFPSSPCLCFLTRVAFSLPLLFLSFPRCLFLFFLARALLEPPSFSVILISFSSFLLDPGPPAVTLPEPPGSAVDHLHDDRYQSPDTVLLDFRDSSFERFCRNSASTDRFGVPRALARCVLLL